MTEELWIVRASRDPLEYTLVTLESLKDILAIVTSTPYGIQALVSGKIVIERLYPKQFTYDAKGWQFLYGGRD